MSGKRLQDTPLGDLKSWGQDDKGLGFYDVVKHTAGNGANASSGSVANASAIAAIAAVVGQIGYCSGLELTGAGSTAGGVVVATLTGLRGGVTLSWIIDVPVGATAAMPALVLNFDPPLEGNGANQAITLTMPALGTGNTNAAACIHGYMVPAS